MAITAIHIPDLSGIANLFPSYIHVVQQLTTTGVHYLRSSVVPPGYVYWITYSSYGHNAGAVTDVMYAIENASNNRLAILSMIDDISLGKTIDLFASFWLREGQKLSCRFNVTSTSPTCWFTAMYLKFMKGGY